MHGTTTQLASTTPARRPRPAPASLVHGAFLGRHGRDVTQRERGDVSAAPVPYSPRGIIAIPAAAAGKSLAKGWRTTSTRGSSSATVGLFTKPPRTRPSTSRRTAVHRERWTAGRLARRWSTATDGRSEGVARRRAASWTTRSGETRARRSRRRPGRRTLCEFRSTVSTSSEARRPARWRESIAPAAPRECPERGVLSDPSGGASAAALSGPSLRRPPGSGLVRDRGRRLVQHGLDDLHARSMLSGARTATCRRSARRR